jgi:serine/threonine protein kinase
MDPEELLGTLDNTYNLLKLGGKGGTAKVYIGYNLNDQLKNKLAIKIFKKKYTDCLFIKNEIEVQGSLNIPNTIKLISHGKGELSKDNGSKKHVAYLVLEYMEYGDLFDFIAFPGKGFGEAMGKKVFMEVLKAVEELHKVDIVHRDIKTENIMIDSKFQVKLADFSFATSMTKEPLLTSVHGTASYNAPELLTGTPYYGVANDIFSLGVTLFLIVTGRKPFKLANSDDFLYELIIQNNYEAYWDKIIKSMGIPLSSNFKSLFINLCAKDYSQRPSIEEIKEHSWIKYTTTPGATEYIDEFTKRAKLVEKRKEIEARKDMHNKHFKVFLPKFRSFDSKDIQFDDSSLSHIYLEYFGDAEKDIKKFREDCNHLVIILDTGNVYRRNYIFLYILKFLSNYDIEVVEHKPYAIKVVLTTNEKDKVKFKISLKRYIDDKHVVEIKRSWGDRFDLKDIYDSLFDYLNKKI